MMLIIKIAEVKSWGTFAVRATIFDENKTVTHHFERTFEGNSQAFHAAEYLASVSAKVFAKVFMVDTTDRDRFFAVVNGRVLCMNFSECPDEKLFLELYGKVY